LAKGASDCTLVSLRMIVLSGRLARGEMSSMGVLRAENWARFRRLATDEMSETESCSSPRS